MKNYFLVALSLIALITIYLFQRFSFVGAFNAIVPEPMMVVNPIVIFSINKAIRLTLNDLACLLLIYSLFHDRIYLRAALFLFLIELCIVLPIYLIIKLSLEGDSELSSPLLSQIHRLVVNPLLMLLLMLGFVYQRLKGEKS